MSARRVADARRTGSQPAAAAKGSVCLFAALRLSARHLRRGGCTFPRRAARPRAPHRSAPRRRGARAHRRAPPADAVLHREASRSRRARWQAQAGEHPGTPARGSACRFGVRWGAPRRWPRGRARLSDAVAASTGFSRCVPPRSHKNARRRQKPHPTPEPSCRLPRSFRDAPAPLGPLGNGLVRRARRPNSQGRLEARFSTVDLCEAELTMPASASSYALTTKAPHPTVRTVCFCDKFPEEHSSPCRFHWVGSQRCRAASC